MNNINNSQTKSRATLESLREFLQTLTQKYQIENLEFTERLLQLGFKDQQEYLAAKKSQVFVRNWHNDLKILMKELLRPRII